MATFTSERDFFFTAGVNLSTPLSPRGISVPKDLPHIGANAARAHALHV